MSRRCVGLAIAIALLALTGCAEVRSDPASTPPALPSSAPEASASVDPMPRELWVWHPRPPDDLVALADTYAITRLLVWVAPGFRTHPRLVSRLGELSRRARISGIELDALCGDPSWATDPQPATSWAAEVNTSGLFARLHLDIEPHALPEWTTRRPALASGLLAALAGAGKSGMPVDADIPYWYDTVTTATGQPLDLAVMRTVNSVTIMAYRDSADGVLAIAAPEMGHAASLGKPAWIGLNTASPAGDPASSSFLGQSPSAIAENIRAVDEAGRQWSTFAGLGLHDSDSLFVLED